MFSAFRMGPASSERRLCDRTSRVRTSHFSQVNTYTIQYHTAASACHRTNTKGRNMKSLLSMTYGP